MIKSFNIIIFAVMSTVLLSQPALAKKFKYEVSHEVPMPVPNYDTGKILEYKIINRQRQYTKKKKRKNLEKIWKAHDKVHDIGPFDENHSGFFHNPYKGLRSDKGKVILAPIYRQIYPFSDRFTRVQLIDRSYRLFDAETKTFSPWPAELDDITFFKDRKTKARSYLTYRNQEKGFYSFATIGRDGKIATQVDNIIGDPKAKLARDKGLVNYPSGYWFNHLDESGLRASSHVTNNHELVPGPGMEIIHSGKTSFGSHETAMLTPLFTLPAYYGGSDKDRTVYDVMFGDGSFADKPDGVIGIMPTHLSEKIRGDKYTIYTGWIIVAKNGTNYDFWVRRSGTSNVKKGLKSPHSAWQAFRQLGHFERLEDIRIIEPLKNPAGHAPVSTTGIQALSYQRKNGLWYTPWNNWAFDVFKNETSSLTGLPSAEASLRDTQNAINARYAKWVADAPLRERQKAEREASIAAEKARKERQKAEALRRSVAGRANNLNASYTAKPDFANVMAEIRKAFQSSKTCYRTVYASGTTSSPICY